MSCFRLFSKDSPLIFYPDFSPNLDGLDNDRARNPSHIQMEAPSHFASSSASSSHSQAPLEVKSDDAFPIDVVNEANSDSDSEFPSLDTPIDKIAEDFFERVVNGGRSRPRRLLNAFKALKTEPTSMKLMMKAINRDDESIIAYFHANKFSFNSKIEKEKTPLLVFAVKNQKFHAFSALFRIPDIDLRAKNEKRITALHLLAEQDRSELSDFLSTCEGRGHLPAILDKPDAKGWTPLGYAAYEENAHAVKVLIAFGADFQSKIAGRRPFNIATTRFLCRDTDASIAISNAAIFKATAERKYPNLLNPDSQQMVTGKEKSSTQHLFFYLDEEAAACQLDVDHLMRRGGNFRIIDENGNGPILHVIQSSYPEAKKLEWVSRLIEAQADLNLQNVGNLSALIVSIQKGHSSIALKLIEPRTPKKRMDLNLRDVRGNSALQWAARTSNLDVVTALIASGVNVNIVNREMQTPLHALAFEDMHQPANKEIIRRLTVAGALDTPDRAGRTASSLLALRPGSDDSILAMLSARPDTRISDISRMNGNHTGAEASSAMEQQKPVLSKHLRATTRIENAETREKIKEGCETAVTVIEGAASVGKAAVEGVAKVVIAVAPFI